MILRPITDGDGPMLLDGDGALLVQAEIGPAGGSTLAPVPSASWIVDALTGKRRAA